MKGPDLRGAARGLLIETMVIVVLASAAFAAAFVILLLT